MRAEAAFGNVTDIRQELYRMSERHSVRQARVRLLEDLRFDLQAGLRAMRRRPLFGLAVVLILALGIGASTAIFGIVRGVLLRPLPYPDPARLVVLWEQQIVRDVHENVVSVRNFEAWRERAQSFQDLAALVPSRLTLRSDVPERLSGAEVSPSWFTLIGWQPARGRAFTEADVRAGEDVIVLSHGLWTRRFGADPGLIGRTIILNERAYSVLGVMPANFEPPAYGWLTDQEYWLPFTPTPENRDWGRSLLVLGRLRDGVTMMQARTELTALGQRLAQESEANRNWSIELRSLHEQVSGRLKSALVVLMTATLLLLAIAIVNVANLTLARAQERRTEFAVRNALGADRGRVLRQLLAEQLGLMLLVVPSALAVAYWALHALRAFFPPDLPRAQHVYIDVQVLLFSLVVCGFTLLLVGSLPVLASTRSRLRDWLHRASPRTVAGVRSSLVITTETALALLLAVSAGLVIRSFAAVRAVDLGFAAEEVVVFRVALPAQTYPEAAQRTQFFDELLTRTRALPGVTSAGVVNVRPLGGASTATRVVPASGPAPEPEPIVDIRNADGDYFRTARITLLQGRLFDARDDSSRPQVAVINRTLARTLWPGLDPTGKHVRVNLNDGMEAQIIGVVADVRLAGPATAPRGTLYFAAAQYGSSALDVLVRTPDNLEHIVAQLRGLVRQLDASLPIYAVDRLDHLVELQTGQERLSSVLLAAFAILALGLVMGGIYAVVALEAARRKRDLGLRLALGATPAQLRSLILRTTLYQALAGLAIGGVASAFLTRYLQTLLFGVQPNDPLTFASAALLLLIVALGAAYLPARRAARLDPLTSLRSE